MVVAVSIQVVSTVEELFDLELVLLGIADAVVHDAGPVDDYLVVK